MASFSITNFPNNDTITEGADLAFTLTRSSDLTSTATVRWDIIQDGRFAALNSDFAARTGTFSFAANEATKNVSITINDDSARGQDRSFSLRLTEVPSSGPEVQIGSDRAITLIEDETSQFEEYILPTTAQHETLVLGSSYTYTGSVTGGDGDDTFIITKYQNLDLTIADVSGTNVIKFDEDVSITHVDVNALVIPPAVNIVRSITLTLETGADITVTTPAGGAYQFQLADGALTNYTDFHAAITASGFENDSDGNATTELNTPIVITAPTSAPNSGNTSSRFTVSSLPDTITEGTNLTLDFTLTPSSALTGATDVRWDIIQNGRFAALNSDFAATTGVVNFANGATAAQNVSITINDDSARGQDRSFSLRLTEVPSSGPEVQIGSDRAITLIEDETSQFEEYILPTTAQHETLVLGSSYTYTGSVTGGDGDDTFIITKYQNLDLTIADVSGTNVIKFDEDVSITHVDVNALVIPPAVNIVRSITLTLETGADITVTTPAGGAYQFQLGDGAVTNYTDFHAEIISGGFAAGSTTELSTAYAITNNKNAPTLIATTTGSTTATVSETFTAETPITGISFTPNDVETSLFAARNFMLSGAGADLFEVVALTLVPGESQAFGLQLKSGAAFNFETTTSYAINVTVSDGSLSSTATPVNIAITNVNEAPTIEGASSRSAKVNENVSRDDLGAIVLNVRDGDRDPLTTSSFTLTPTDGFDPTTLNTLFEIFASPTVEDRFGIRLIASLDHETKDSYAIDVTVSDGIATSKPTALTITVNDDDEAPTATDSGITANDRTTYIFTANDFGFTDPDDDDLTSIRIETLPTLGRLMFDNAGVIGPVTAGQTVLENAIGNLTYVPFDGNTNTTTSFTYLVTSTNASTSAASTSAAAATLTITINNEGAANTPPTLNSVTAAGSVAENVQGADISDIRFTPSDAETSSFTNTSFMLSGTGAGLFDVVSREGASFGVKLKSTEEPLDHEVTPSYTIMVTVIDGGFTSSTPVALMITVTDANDAPVLGAVTGATIMDASGVFFTASRVREGDSLTGNLSGTDQDGDVVTFAAERAGATTMSDTTVTVKTGINSTHRVDGTYGKFYYNSSTGDYQFKRDETAINKVSLGITANDTFAIRAVDPDNAMSAPKNLVFTVTGGNDSPTLHEGITAVGDVDENVRGVVRDIKFTPNDLDESQIAFVNTDFSLGAGTGSTLNDDEVNALFEVYALDEVPGQAQAFGLRIKSTATPLNYEAEEVYAINLRVSDEHSGEGSTFLSVTVNNVNETDASVSIARTTGSGAVSIGDVYTATLTPDLDLPSLALGNYTYQWLRGDTVVTTGTTNSPYTVTAADSNSSIKARVIYTDPGNSSQRTVESNAVTTPVYNSPPSGSLTATPALSTLENIGEGLTLTENFTDADGINTATKSLVAYYSKQTYANLAALNAASNKMPIALAGSGSRINLTKAMFEQQIYAVFSYTDNVGTAESVFENLGYFDAGDSATAATRLAEVLDGNTLNGHLEGSDTDFFSFVLASERLVTFTEIEVGRLTSGNLYLALVDSNGVAQTNSTEIRGITALKTTLGAGTHYVRASGAEGDYSLTYTANKPAPFTIPATKVTGDANSNSLNGGSGAETIQGGAGNDTIRTNGGADLIIGGYGNDTINLSGGAETILYRYESDANGNVTWKATDGGDTINSFRRGTDKLYFIDISDDGDPHNDFAELSTDSANGRFTVTLGYGFGPGGFTGGLMIVSVIIKFDIPGDSSAGDTLTIKFDTSGPLQASSGSVESHFIQRDIGGTNTSVLNEFHYLDDLFGGTASFDVIAGDSLGDLIIL